MMIFPSGSFTSRHTFHSCSCRTFPRLEQVRPGGDLQHDLDDVAHRDVGNVRPVPASPAQVEADAILREPADGVVERLDADPGDRW
jgi:hypothetical protein